MAKPPPNHPLGPFARRRTGLLTTYKRDGTPVATPVTIAVEGDHAFVRTYDRAWKALRMRNNPAVLVAPSTVRGKPRGEDVAARVRLLDGEEAQHAARALAKRQRILQGILVPLLHRAMRYRTLHYELTPSEIAAPHQARGGLGSGELIDGEALSTRRVEHAARTVRDPEPLAGLEAALLDRRHRLV